MSTLLIRLAAPLQSWGADSKFEERRGTMREPTKSGVVGMLAAALGRRRDEAIDDLAGLKFGVRVDWPGQLLKDFHTARIEGSKAPYVTNRYYLADAVFVAGLEGDDAFVRSLDKTLRDPVFPLFLGRRSCPPVGRISLGVFEESLEDALKGASWQACPSHVAYVKKQKIPHYLTIVLDAPEVGDYRRRDLPISFSQNHRRHTYRYLSENPRGKKIYEPNETAHDALSAVEGEI